LFYRTRHRYAFQVSFRPHRMHDVCGGALAIAGFTEYDNVLLSSAEQAPHGATGGKT
jgi:hypothetical protein